MTWNEAKLHRWYAIYAPDNVNLEPDTSREPSFLYWFFECDESTLGESDRVKCNVFHIPSMLMMDSEPTYRATNFTHCTLIDMTEWENFKSDINDNRDALDWIKIRS